MIRRILLNSYKVAEPWLRDPNWTIRRTAQAAVIGILTIWLALPRTKETKDGVTGRSDELSTRLAKFLYSVTARSFVGYIWRLFVLWLSVRATMREHGCSDERNFVLRLDGPINQKALRNLLIWQNHILPSYLPQDDGRQVDVGLALTSGSDSQPRLFDLFSVVLMLARFRSFAVSWDEKTFVGASPLISERGGRRAGEPNSDLGEVPGDVIRQVELSGTHGGVKLLPQGRKQVNDFLKLALPGQFIVAVALRERDDGTVKPNELELWLGFIDMLHARHPQTAFVVLNVLAPSQWREWPTHVRFARHQGLSLQDAVCLAQIADGYLGVLDLFGLAAHSADRPGVYVPIDEGEPLRAERLIENSKEQRIMVGSRDRADIETALENFVAALPQP